MRAESLNWLRMTANTTTTTTANNAMNQPTQHQNTAPRHVRRASIASTNLVYVQNSVREIGYDYLQRIPRSNRVNLGGANVSHIATVGDDSIENVIDESAGDLPDETDQASEANTTTAQESDDGD